MGRHIASPFPGPQVKAARKHIRQQKERGVPGASYNPSRAQAARKIDPSAPGFYSRTQGQDITTTGKEGGPSPGFPTEYMRGIENWDSWYNAYRKTGVDVPMEEQADPTFDKGWFRPTEEAEVELLTQGELEIPGTDAYLPKGTGTTAGALIKLEEARQLYEPGQGSEWLTAEAGVESAKEAKTQLGREYEAQKRQIATQRGMAARGMGEETRAAEAAMARGGFEYSAPAMSATRGADKGQPMEDVHEAAFAASQKYDLSKKMAQEEVLGKEAELEEVGGDWTKSQSDYIDTLEGLYSGAQGALEGSFREFEGLIASHKVGGGIAPGMGGTAFRGSQFKEGFPGVSEWQTAKTRLDLSETLIGRLQLARQKVQGNILAGESGETFV